MSLNNVPAGKDVPNDFNVIIEIPMNADPVKYEVDKASGAIFVYATTEPSEALLLGGNTAALSKGRITQFGRTIDVAGRWPCHVSGARPSFRGDRDRSSHRQEAICPV